MMINLHTIGQISLNISFVIYLIIYLPQIKHNQNRAHLKQLSMGLHLILVTSFSFDLMYSLLKPLPWQYQTVSIFALVLLGIQHMQLFLLAYRTNHLRHIKILCLSFLCLLSFFVMFFTQRSLFQYTAITSAIGYLSRVGFLAYMLPQIIQNYKKREAEALSTAFINLSLLLTILDLISAWCLQWGWPNQLGTPITLLLTIILKWQSIVFGKGHLAATTAVRAAYTK